MSMKRFVAGLGALVFYSGAALAGSEVSRSFRTVANAGGVEHVLVDISIGEVTIRSGSTSQIEVTGTIERNYEGVRGRRKAKEILDDTEIEVTVRGDRASIRERLGPSARSGRGRWLKSQLDIRITLPSGVNLEVEQSIGELDIAGDFRDVDVEMGIGELTVRLPKKNIRELNVGATIGEVHTDVGDRVFTREGLFAGRTHYVNSGGTNVVDVHLKVGEVEVSLD
jgi:hypothetical protein